MKATQLVLSAAIGVLLLACGLFAGILFANIPAFANLSPWARTAALYALAALTLLTIWVISAADAAGNDELLREYAAAGSDVGKQAEAKRNAKRMDIVLSILSILVGSIIGASALFVYALPYLHW